MKQKRKKKNYKIGLNNLGEEIEPVAFIVGILKSIHTIWPSTLHCVTSIIEQNHPTKNIYKKKKKKTTKNTKNITFMNSPNEKFKGGRAKIFIIFFFRLIFIPYDLSSQVLDILQGEQKLQQFF